MCHASWSVCWWMRDICDVDNGTISAHLRRCCCNAGLVVRCRLLYATSCQPQEIEYVMMCCTLRGHKNCLGCTLSLQTLCSMILIDFLFLHTLSSKCKIFFHLFRISNSNLDLMTCFYSELSLMLMAYSGYLPSLLISVKKP